jgi:hypothetical protein
VEQLEFGLDLIFDAVKLLILRVTNGGHGMVQQLLLRCHGRKQHEFLPRVCWML